MKKIMIYVLLLAMPVALLSQQTTNNVLPVKIDYLQKSKNQKTAAWIMLGGGLGLTIGGAVVAFNEVLDGIGSAFGTGQSQSSSMGGIMLFIGGASVFGSIPVFISAAKNKGRWLGASTGFKMEKIPVVLKNSFTTNSYPAISLKISL